MNNVQGQLVKVDKVYRERAYSDARHKPEPARWSQTIQRYSGEAGNVTFVDIDRTSPYSPHTNTVSYTNHWLSAHNFDQIGSIFCQVPASAMTERIWSNEPSGIKYDGPSWGSTLGTWVSYIKRMMSNGPPGVLALMTQRAQSDSPSQVKYWAVDFDIVITLGTVEIKAYVEWEENVSHLSSGPGSACSDYNAI